jgi:hypothetical protein
VGPFAWNERHPRLRRGPAEDRDFSLRRPNNQTESPRSPSVFADETRTTARDKAPSTPLSGPVLLKDIDEMVHDKDRKTNDACPPNDLDDPTVLRSAFGARALGREDVR